MSRILLAPTISPPSPPPPHAELPPSPSPQLIALRASVAEAAQLEQSHLQSSLAASQQLRDESKEIASLHYQLFTHTTNINVYKANQESTQAQLEVSNRVLSSVRFKLSLLQQDLAQAVSMLNHTMASLRQVQLERSECDAARDQTKNRIVHIEQLTKDRVTRFWNNF